MTSSDRIYALLDKLTQYKTGELCDDIAVDAREHSLLPPALHNPSPHPKPKTRSRMRLTLLSRTKELISTPVPKPPPKPYEPKSSLHSNFPLLKKADYEKNYKETDARLQGKLDKTSTPRRASSIATIRTLTRKLSPLRTRDLRSNDSADYKDVTVADIDAYGMYEMTIRGDIPKDADLGPIFFDHPGDVQPALMAKVLETREAVQSATKPRIREDIPRHFSTVKFDIDLLDQELNNLIAPQDCSISFAIGNNLNDKIVRTFDTISDHVDRCEPLGRPSDGALLRKSITASATSAKADKPTPLKPEANSVPVNLMSIDMPGAPSKIRLRYTPELKTAISLAELKGITTAIQTSAPKMYSYLLSHDYIYDFNVPICEGKILSNTNVFQAMMIQYAFISSYIGFIIDKLQRLLSYMHPISGAVNGADVISLALSAYFRPFVDLTALPESAYINLIISDELTPIDLQASESGPGREEIAAVAIQAYCRMLIARKKFVFQVRSKKAAHCIQVYGRRHIARRQVQHMLQQKKERMSVRLAEMKEALAASLDAVTQKLIQDTADPLMAPNQQHKLHDLITVDINFWKKALRKGYVPQAYIYCIFIATRPAQLCNQKLLTHFKTVDHKSKASGAATIADSAAAAGPFLRHDVCSLNVTDYSLLVDPRMQLIVLCDGEYTGIPEIKLALQQLYRDALPLSKIDINRLSVLDNAELLAAFKEYRELTANTNLLLDLQFGKTMKIFKQSILDAMAQTGGSADSLVFFLPYAHQQFDLNYREVSFVTGIPIYGLAERESLYYTSVQEALKSDQKFSSLSNSSIDRSRTRGPERVASFGTAPTQLLPEDEVLCPESWSRAATSAMVNLKYPAAILRPNMMCYFPGCDILGDGLGGLACSMSEMSGDRYAPTKTNMDLYNDIKLASPYRIATEAELIKCYQGTDAVLQCMPENTNVVRYVSFALMIDRNGQYVIINSYAEVPSYSYFPVGKLMSACYIAPALNDVEIFTTAVGLFASCIAATYKYAGYMTLNFIMTTGYKRGEDRGMICPRLMFNGITYGITPRILTTIYQTTLASTKYEHLLFMTSLGNSLVNRENMFALIQLISKVQASVSALQRTSTEINVTIGGWSIEEAFTTGNAVLSVFQRESTCEDVIMGILKEKKGNLYAQERFEELGSSPFYVCGLNNIVHGQTGAPKPSS